MTSAEADERCDIASCIAVSHDGPALPAIPGTRAATRVVTFGMLAARFLGDVRLRRLSPSAPRSGSSPLPIRDVEDVGSLLANTVLGR